MTYGALRLRLSKLCPGTDIEVVDGWIQDRYTEILDSLPWKRQETETIFQVPASYATGTLAATQSSNAITGTGTTWTSAMNGRRIRVNNTSEYYTFTYVSGTTATLDRVFESPTATGLAYRIDQAIFLLPATARIVRQVHPLHNRNQPLELVTPGEMNRITASRNWYGTPKYAAPTWDSATDPPQLQLELFPAPSVPDSSSSLLSFGVDQIYDQADIDPTSTSTSMLPFVRPACLIAGVQADFAALKGDQMGIITYEARFKKLVGDMAMINALQRGPQKIRLAPELIRQAPPRYRKGPWHRGFTG